MNESLAIVLALLTAAIAMFVTNRPRMDAVALIMLTALPLTGVLSMNEALAGFSDANVVLIAAMFVMGEGLVRTGVAQRQGGQQRNALARSSNAGRLRSRLDHELDPTVVSVRRFLPGDSVT